MSKSKFYTLIVLLAIAVAVLIFLVAELILQYRSEAQNQANSETAAETMEIPEPVQVVEPRFPQYILKEGPLSDPEGFRGTEWVVIGKDGYLFENGYINEYLGYAPKYVNVTDGELQHRVDTLKYIQDELAKRNIAFCVVISPSKASSLPQMIPDFYKAEHTTPDGYVRPYIRFKDFLEKTGVYFIDSESLYKTIGLTNTFPKTGIHWNKMASFETTLAVIKEYERQTGTQIRHLAADSIFYKDTLPPFVTNEQDIFGIVYEGRRQEMKDAIIDEKYYWPDIYTADKGNPKIGHMTIQGGSFTGDFNYYFGELGIAGSVTSYYYNHDNNVRINWESEIGRTNFVLLEVNEQFVYNMGGSAPQWAEKDFEILPLGNNIIDSLYDYLQGK